MRRNNIIDDVTQRHNLALNFRVLKAMINITNSELSPKVLLNPSILSCIENPDRPIKLDHVNKIARFFEITSDDLLDKQAKITFI